MSRSVGFLVIAADPLLRKAVTEALTAMADGGGIEAVSPTRATPERIADSDTVVLAAFERDLAPLEPTLAAATASARSVLLIAAGMRDGGRALLGRFKTSAKEIVAIPELSIREELLRAAPKLEAALKQLRMQNWRPPEAVKAGPTPAAIPRTESRAVTEPAPSGAPYLGVVVCIGASTGGTDALLTVLSGMPKNCAPIAIVQHMPEAYVPDFAERLNQSCVIDVELARDNVALRPGLAVLAPGGRQFRLRKDGRGIWTQLGESERIGGHCPAVDVMMKSAAEALGKRAIGVILTGMGRDGADGLMAMRRAGARTAAQDEATSIVYGMPKAAYEEGAADSVMPLQKVAGWISGLTLSLTK